MLPRATNSLLLASILTPLAFGQSNELVSLASNGAQGDLQSSGGIVSADGRFVAFTSDARNFAANDPDGSNGPDTDAFLRDRMTGATIHVNAAFRAGIAQSLSADGSSVSFFGGGTTSWGGSLSRHWVWERSSGLVQPVATGDLDCWSSVLSGDGRFVAFSARDVSASSPAQWSEVQVMLLDRATGTRTLLSRGLGGGFCNGLCSSVAISRDGMRVAFTSAATDLVPSDTNDSSDVYLFDVPTNSLQRVSVDPQGVQSDAGSVGSTLSDDGRFVAFMSVASNLVPGSTNHTQAIFRRELATGSMEMMSLAETGAQVGGGVSYPKISGDGNQVFFTASSPFVVQGDTNQVYDVFVRDARNHTTQRLSSGVGGVEANGACVLTSVSADGRFVAFQGQATNLVANDVNGVQDVFLLDRGPQCNVSSFCSTLPNSTGIAASIAVQGVPSFSANNLVLSASGLPTSTIGRFEMGTSPVDPGTPFGNGRHCVGGSVRRLGTVTAAGSVAVQPQDLTAPAFAGVHPGDTRYFQFVFRDVAAGGAGFNTSDAALVTYCP